MNPPNTLHEYHLRYPHTVEFPTLVQNGLIGVLLQRQQQKAARKARRRALFHDALKRLFT